MKPARYPHTHRRDDWSHAQTSSTAAVDMARRGQHGKQKAVSHPAHTAWITRYVTKNMTFLMS